MGLKLRAPAKINWTLEVLGRRADDYHEVRTVLQTIDLWDVLEVEPHEDVVLEVAGSRQAHQDDLTLRAARLLAQEAGSPQGARLRLHKHIPMAAGLGGGSSDAAAALRGLDLLWGLSYSRERLARLGAALGSDVPFFLYGGTALAEGRGEQVSPLPDLPEVWLVLLVPDLTISEKTRRLYQALTPADFSDGSRTAALVQHLRAGGSLPQEVLCNAFQRAAYDLLPGLTDYRDALLAAGARHVQLAGSGPALFALAADRAEAEGLRAALRPPGGQVFLVRSVPATEAIRTEVRND